MCIDIICAKQDLCDIIVTKDANMSRLRNVRRRKLLSQRDLAARAGIAPSTIYLVKNGKSAPRLLVMRKICEILGGDEFRRVIEETGPGGRC